MWNDNVKADELLFVDNYPSWRKTWMLLRLYWPVLKSGAIIYPLVVIAIFAVSLLLKSITGEWFDKLLWWPLSLMMLCSPIMLTKHDYRTVTAQLPATATDKLGFLLLVFWIVFPALIYIAVIASACLAEYVLHYDLSELMKTGAVSGKELVIGIVVSYSLIAISLYYAVTSRTNRSLAAMLSVFGYYIGLIILIGVMSFGVGIYAGFTEAAIGSGEIDEEYMRMWAEQLPIIATGIFGIIALVHLIKLHKKLRNCGF